MGLRERPRGGRRARSRDAGTVRHRAGDRNGRFDPRGSDPDIHDSDQRGARCRAGARAGRKQPGLGTSRSAATVTQAAPDGCH